MLIPPAVIASARGTSPACAAARASSSHALGKPPSTETAASYSANRSIGSLSAACNEMKPPELCPITFPAPVCSSTAARSSMSSSTE